MQRSSHDRDTAAKAREPTALSTVEPKDASREAQLAAMFATGNEILDQMKAKDSPRVYILSGPSGVGKDSVILGLRDQFPETKYVVTCTTRPIRPGEEDGLHYEFMTHDEFERELALGNFLESAEVYGNWYGVPRTPIERALAKGRDVLIKVDVQGAETLRTKIRNAISIFLAPESMESLYNWLANRKTEDPDILLRRFGKAGEEMKEHHKFDYVVFNYDDQLESTVAQIIGVIRSERLRISQPSIELR